jgi:hypothetical protein
VAAAARELRPVELVGIYEGQKEALDKELAAARAEVRTLRNCGALNCLIAAAVAVAVAAWGLAEPCIAAEPYQTLQNLFF